MRAKEEMYFVKGVFHKMHEKSSFFHKNSCFFSKKVFEILTIVCYTIMWCTTHPEFLKKNESLKYTKEAKHHGKEI